MMKLTKKELQLFKAVALFIPDTTTQLAKITNTSLSYTSTTLKKLGKKGLITQQRYNNEKKPQIAETQHASRLRRIIQETPHLNLDIIANKATTILAALTCKNIRTNQELLEESDVSYSTLWNYIEAARGIGLIHKSDTITISPRYHEIKEFIQSYQNYIHQKQATKLAQDAHIKWGCQDTYIFETTKTLNLQPTGISAFKKYGALFLTPRNLYINTEKPLRLEDHIINHILSEGKQNTLPLLIVWSLNVDKIDTEYLNQRSYRLKTKNITETVQTYLQTRGKQKPEYLINWTEFTEKLKEYKDE